MHWWGYSDEQRQRTPENHPEGSRDVFNRFLDISPSDRYYLINEHLETILNDYDRDDILLVPDNMNAMKKKGGRTNE